MNVNASGSKTRACRLTVSDLGKDYDLRPILRGVDFEVATGEVLVITGVNGVGKSTLLRVMAGLARPASGSVTYHAGEDRLEGDGLRAAVGYAAPDLRPYDELTPAENVDFLARIKGLETSSGSRRALLERVGLDGAIDRPAGTLSTGQRQRLRLALADLGDPSFLLLDEPGSNLDQSGREFVAAMVESSRRRGPVVIATNDPEEARLGERRFELETVG